MTDNIDLDWDEGLRAWCRYMDAFHNKYCPQGEVCSAHQPSEGWVQPTLTNVQEELVRLRKRNAELEHALATLGVIVNEGASM